MLCSWKTRVKPDVVVGGWQVGEPEACVMAPGCCQLSAEWCALPLVARTWVSKDTLLCTFELPDKTKPLGLSTCACLLARCSTVVRPYTPVSTNAMLGKFQLLVKVYEGGVLSTHLRTMNLGDTIEFKHIDVNVKRQYPFGVDHVGMLVGGTGITPMIQALHAILGTKGDVTRVTLLYGSRTADGILGKDMLDRWAELFPSRLNVVYVLSNEGSDSSWQGARE